MIKVNENYHLGIYGSGVYKVIRLFHTKCFTRVGSRSGYAGWVDDHASYIDKYCRTCYEIPAKETLNKAIFIAKSLV